jgi:small-conductance mechanosensitive channel
MEGFSRYFTRPYAEIGTPLLLLLALGVYFIGKNIIRKKEKDYREAYRKRHFLSTVVVLVTAVVLIVLWARLLQHTGTFLGLLGGGLAIALKEPLVAIAGRIAILAGRAYTVGDRIQVDQLTGDVIHVGFFYTRVMEVGKWIAADQATGRIVQFSNSKMFGATPVYNYTRDFSYIWDEQMLPVTYASNVEQATRILLNAGNEYTKEFLQGAEEQLERMRHSFLVPTFELKPQVFMAVNSNWVELRMRYIVDPKKRRVASNFIWQCAFRELQHRDDITIASTTSEVTVHWPEAREALSAKDGDAHQRTKRDEHQVTE